MQQKYDKHYECLQILLEALGFCRCAFNKDVVPDYARPLLQTMCSRICAKWHFLLKLNNLLCSPLPTEQ